MAERDWKIRLVGPNDIGDFPMLPEHQVLVDFLTNDSMRDQSLGLSKTWGGFLDGTLVAYATMFASEVKTKKTLHTMNDPCKQEYTKSFSAAIRLGRFAVIKDLQGQGYGTKMMDHVKAIAVVTSRLIGCRFLVVDSKQNAIDSYKRWGFRFLGEYKSDPQAINSMWFDLAPPDQLASPA